MFKGILFTVFCILLPGPCPAAQVWSATGHALLVGSTTQEIGSAGIMSQSGRSSPGGSPIAELLMQKSRPDQQPGSAVLSATNVTRLVAGIVVSVMLCLAMLQSLLAHTESRQHHALTTLIVIAFIYEFAQYGQLIFNFGAGLGSISRLVVPAECALMLAAVRFVSLLFDVKSTRPGLYDIIRVVYVMLGVLAPVSLFRNQPIRDASHILVWISIALMGLTAATYARSSRRVWLDFMLACLPFVLGAAASNAMPNSLLQSGNHHSYVTDFGLLGTLILFTLMLARRLDHERREQEISLRDTQRRYQLALEGSNDGIFEWDMKASHVLASRRAHEIFAIEYEQGWRPQSVWQALIPQTEFDRFCSMPESLLTSDNMLHVETWFADRHGGKRHLLVQGKLDLDTAGNPLRVIGSVSDVSAQKRLEERLRYDALHDFLTGLPNRTLLTDRIGRVIKRLNRNPEARAALLFVGLDNFKSVNDNLGHGFGDQVLISVADRLVEFVRASDTVARFGGDEFVILLEDMFSHREAERFANRILAKIQSPLEIQRQHLAPSVSIGLTFVEDPNISAETVLGDADIAMYAAKENGKGRVVAFETTMRTRAAKRLELESALHNAMENEELYLTYQPIFSLEEEQPVPVGVEALLRWSSSDRTDIAPSELLSLAEENGTIEEIGKWVIRTAANQLANWRSLGYPDDFYVNINLSPVHFESDDIVSTILKEVDPLGVPRNALRIEIVETAVIRYPEKALSVIKLLQSQGILVSIDDFGTGFSSLSYLHRFPFHALKIDRSFVSEIVESKATRDIVTAIVVLARRLGIKVVAEGIENAAQLEFLKSIGCHRGQGFLLARPKETVDHLFLDRTVDDMSRSSTVERKSVRESPAPTVIAPQYQ